MRTEPEALLLALEKLVKTWQRQVARLRADAAEEEDRRVADVIDGCAGELEMLRRKAERGSQ